MPTKKTGARAAATAKRGAAKRGTTTARKTTRGSKAPARKTTARKSSSRAGSRTARSSTASQGQITTDHTEIRRWVEERGGYPATVTGTGGKSGAGVLRIDYPGYSGADTLERISWDEFFEKFDEAQLAFLYQDEMKDGEPSRFSKLIDRNDTQARKRS